MLIGRMFEVAETSQLRERVSDNMRVERRRALSARRRAESQEQEQIQADRNAELLEAYVPPKELRPGTSGEQLRLLQLESEIIGGFQAADTRKTLKVCFDLAHWKP